MIRGVFQAGMDYFLGERAQKMVAGKYWKCWAQMHLSAGKFRMSYIDYRINRCVCVCVCACVFLSASLCLSLALVESMVMISKAN